MFKCVAVAAHTFLPEALTEAGKVAAFFHEHGVPAEHGLLYDEHLTGGLAHGRFDLWVALGGDGTMLRSGQLCGPARVPVLGINMGTLGFLLGIQRHEWRQELSKLLAGAYWLEPRLMLDVIHWRGDEQLGGWHVLNEAMVARGDVMRPVRLAIAVDGSHLTSIVADGLIAATPTGSTAYALAAGGPILPPLLRNFLIVPVAPHLSFNRAIVLPEGSRVTIQVATLHKASISLDGQNTLPLLNGDRVEVCASRHTVEFVRLQEPDYFFRNLTSRMNAFQIGQADAESRRPDLNKS
jgi:NAD+ kinase